MKDNIKKIFLIFMMVIYFINTSFVFGAEVVNINASDLIPRAEITVTPSSATFVEDSIFEVPILLNTKGKSMNTVELNIQYDPKKLSIVKPSTGKSIIGIWVQPPKYDNTKGTANFAGSIPGGIVSDSSLIITITFQAKSAGTTEVRVMDTSSVLANDGIGTQAKLSTSRGSYTILPKPPGGLTIYSDTHPFQDHWYNNNSPTLGWNRDPEVIGFSYILDNKPNTIPDNQNISNDSSKSYQDLSDGLWYFHIKALRKGGAWGTTTHHLIRVDTTSPAKFSPKVNYLNDDNINRALITFFTTDSLSGMDHYEIGVIDKTQAETSSPLFVRSESPYQVPASAVENSRVIIRAYDVAGNSTDVQVSVRPPSIFVQWFLNNSSLLLIILLILLLLGFLIHYLWAHNILKKIRIIAHLLGGKHKEDVNQVVKEVEEVIGEQDVKNEVIKEEDIKKEVTEVLKEEKLEDVKPEIKKVEPEVKDEEIEEIKPEPVIEIIPQEPVIQEVVESEMEVPKPPIYVAPIEIPEIKDIKPENSISMQTVMIKDKLSKPIVNFQTVVDQELPNTKL